MLIDSVQSQANRLEEALLEAAKEGTIRLPRVGIFRRRAQFGARDFFARGAAPYFRRDPSRLQLGRQGFPESSVGERVAKAKADDATAILEISPTALLFGAWNSTGEGGGVGAKFARAIVSEIAGIGVPVEERVDPRTGEIFLRTAGRRTGSRIDPLGILRSVEVYKGESGWDVDKAKAGKKAKKARPSEINHGNITPSIEPLGSLATTPSRLPSSPSPVSAGCGSATVSQERCGPRLSRRARPRRIAGTGRARLCPALALRSRLRGPAPLQLVGFDGAAETIDLDLAAARRLHEEAFDKAKAAGFEFSAEPIRLKPKEKLVQIVRESQNKALRDEGGEAEGE